MKELNVAVKELCENLTEAQHEQWEHCKERGSYYGVDKGRKYLKIVSYDDASGGGAQCGVSSMSVIPTSKLVMFLRVLVGRHLL